MGLAPAAMAGGGALFGGLGFSVVSAGWVGGVSWLGVTWRGGGARVRWLDWAAWAR